jgi:hypothetical protein
MKINVLKAIEYKERLTIAQKLLSKELTTAEMYGLYTEVTQ